MAITFTMTNITAGGHPATLLEFAIGDDGNLDPSELPAIMEYAATLGIDGTKGVVISGRGPVWLFGALLHQLHVTRWSATFDPRQGAVVVASHHPASPKPGTVLPIPKA